MIKSQAPAYQREDPVFKLTGRLDLTARAQLSEVIEPVWDSCQRLLLDLSQVDEVDLSGLSWLLMVDTHLRQRGCRLEIVHPSAAVLRALNLLKPATGSLTAPTRQTLDPDGRSRWAVGCSLLTRHAWLSVTTALTTTLPKPGTPGCSISCSELNKASKGGSVAFAKKIPQECGLASQRSTGSADQTDRSLLAPTLRVNCNEKTLL